MRRIPRPDEPESFLRYRKENSEERNWEEFISMSAYEDAKRRLIDNQSCLCAYCEAKLPDDARKVRVEHFHAKADKDPAHNWMLDWKNLLVVCLSVAQANETCDVAKERVQSGKRKVSGVPSGYAIEGYLLNPYELPECPLFAVEKKSGCLYPNEETCGRVTIPGNRFSTVAELVEKTIDVLNLNERHLCRQRLTVCREYDRLRSNLRRDRSTASSVRMEIARRWFGDGRVLSFYTTRRFLLGKFAEEQIAGKECLQ